MDDQLAPVNTLPYGYLMSKPRLSKEDWLAAGFRALADNGPAALRAEAIARALGTTKGSFYWHFADLPAYKAAMLALWREKVAAEIIARVMAAPRGWPRLDALVAEAAMPPPDEFGGKGIESAIRAWALADADVSGALQDMDKLRIGFTAELLNDAGQDGATLAPAIYAAYVGLDDLAAKGHGDIGQGLNALINLLRDTS